MKKTIEAMALIVSAAASADANLSEIAKDNHLNVACVAATKTEGRFGSGFALTGGNDLSAANNFFHKKLNANGCADGQIQILTNENIQIAVTPVML